MTSVPFLLCLLGVASALPQQFFPTFNQKAIPTLTNRLYQADPQGQYTSSVMQSDGQFSQEQGVLKTGPEGNVLTKKGNFGFITPEGIPVRIDYSADEFGYHPTGNVIPVAPGAAPALSTTF